MTVLVQEQRKFCRCGNNNKNGDFFKKILLGDFPGSPVVKTQLFHCRGLGFDPWSGN